MQDRAQLPWLHRLEDHVDREQVRHPADDHAADGQHPPVREREGDPDDGNPEQQPEDEAEVDDQAQLPLADVAKHAVRQLGPLLHLADDHQLHVEELVDVVADLGGDLAHDVRQLLLHPGVDRLADPRRQVVPEARVLAAHDPLDDIAHVLLEVAMMCSAIRSGSSWR